ncbi:MAG: hypothetical protein ABI882_14355 [Acidobacteriota bacterium]
MAGCGSGEVGGPARDARLAEPFGVGFDRRGNWYICEYRGQRITRVDTAGRLTAFAGSDPSTAPVAGLPAREVKFHEPHGLVITRDDQMYVADMLNHRVIRIGLRTQKADVVAGTGEAGYGGDGGPATAAKFNQMYALELGRAGDRLYLTDLRNRRIRLLDLKSGVIETIAGNGEKGVPTDSEEAVRSPLVDPRAATVDSKGNLYILERGGNALRVVDLSGRIRTLLGPGNELPAPSTISEKLKFLNGPKHLCVDRTDNVIIADTENHIIRVFRPKDGTTVNLVGTGEAGSLIVSDDPLKTQLNRPHGVMVHPSGALYVSDSGNNRVLKMTGW